MQRANNLAETDVNLAETNQNLAETSLNLAETVVNLAQTVLNLAETVVNLAESHKPCRDKSIHEIHKALNRKRTISDVTVLGFIFT
ncbi:MAG: hypothetical protein ABS934_04120 [Psychrobacillus sp.]